MGVRREETDDGGKACGVVGVVVEELGPFLVRGGKGGGHDGMCEG